jgi:hypothetical protein
MMAITPMRVEDIRLNTVAFRVGEDLSGVSAPKWSPDATRPKTPPLASPSPIYGLQSKQGSRCGVHRRLQDIG